MQPEKGAEPGGVEHGAASYDTYFHVRLLRDPFNGTMVKRWIPFSMDPSQLDPAYFSGDLETQHFFTM